MKQQEYGKEYLDVLNAHYGPHNVIAPESLKVEYPLFVNAIRAYERLCTSTTREMLLLISKSALQVMFPNMAKVATIGLLLPMSTADCERGFSTLQQIKTDLCSRLSNRILNCVLLISIESPSPTDFPTSFVPAKQVYACEGCRTMS